MVRPYRVDDAGSPVMEGVPQDYSEALKWFRLAAVQDVFGILTPDSLSGITKNNANALRRRRFAAQSSAIAQYTLGHMYEIGDQVPQDYALAHMWYNLAASRGNSTSALDYAYSRDVLAEYMTREQIAEAERLAREWKPKTWEELQAE